MSTSRLPKDFRKLTKQILAAGWTIERTRSSHFRFKSPDGKTMIICGSTPEDPRSLLNFKADFRRAGVKI